MLVVVALVVVVAVAVVGLSLRPADRDRPALVRLVLAPRPSQRQVSHVRPLSDGDV